MTRTEVVKKYPIGSKFKVIKTGEIVVVGSYGTGLMGVLIKKHYNDLTGFNTYEIEPVEPEKSGLRMYFFVMYNLSGIQKGIQAGHAAIEYYLKYGNITKYQEFAEHHKTFILLDGGGSNDMTERSSELENFGVDYATFYEPDLNDSLSAITFIVPEEIYGMDQAFIDHAIIDPSFMTEDIKFARYLKGFRLASN